MPLYEYECGACGRRFELIRKFSDAPVDVCTLCGKGPVTRLFSSPAIQFKGSGWYITDYSQKGKADAGSSSERSDKPASDAASSDSAKSDSKTESTAKPASSSSAPAKSGGTSGT
jgi:putative FmdB family regulatory protein